VKISTLVNHASQNIIRKNILMGHNLVVNVIYLNASHARIKEQLALVAIRVISLIDKVYANHVGPTACLVQIMAKKV
jgi:hypothetical protein